MSADHIKKRVLCLLFFFCATSKQDDQAEKNAFQPCHHESRTGSQPLELTKTRDANGVKTREEIELLLG